MYHKNHLVINSYKIRHVFHHFSNILLLLVNYYEKKKCSCHKHKAPSHWLWELSKCYLLSFALLICKCAKLTILSTEIRTTLRQSRNWTDSQFCLQTWRAKNTLMAAAWFFIMDPSRSWKSSKELSHQKLKIFQGSLLAHPFLSGEFWSKIFSTERGFWNYFHSWTLCKF